MKRRIVSMLLAVVMVLMLSAVSNAAGPAKVRIYAEKGSGEYFVNQETGGRESVYVTDAVLANVELKDGADADVCSGVIIIKYNPAEVVCLGYRHFIGGTWQVNDKTDGVLRMAFSRSDSDEDGIVFGAAFDLLDGVEECTFSVEVEELLTGDVVDGDVPADYMMTQDSVTYEEGAEPDYLLGDANCDDKVNTADATAVLKHSADMITLEDKGLIQADVNKDQKVNTSDASLILKYSAGMIDHF